MADKIFTPVRVTATNRLVDMANAKGEHLSIRLPNASGAAFVATAIQNELTAAKRGT